MIQFKEVVFGLSAIKKLVARCREHVEVAFNMTLSGVYDPSDYYGDQIGRCNLKTLLSLGTDDVFFKMMHLLVIGDGLNNLVNVISVIQRFFFVLSKDGKIYFSKQDEMQKQDKRRAFQTNFETVYLKRENDNYMASDLEELFHVIFSPVMTNSPFGDRYEDAFTGSDEGKKTQSVIAKGTLMLETPEKWTTIIDEAFHLKRNVTSEDFDDATAWSQLTAVCLSCLVGPTNVYEEFVTFFSKVYPLIDETSKLDYHHRGFEPQITEGGKVRKSSTPESEYVVSSFFASNVPNPMKSVQNLSESPLLMEARNKWTKLFSNPFRKVTSSEKLRELRDWIDRWSPLNSTMETTKRFLETIISWMKINR